MRMAVALVLCAPLLAGSAWLMRNDEHVQKGQDAYDAGDFQASARFFRKAMTGTGDSDIIQFDLGTALAGQGAQLADPAARARALSLAIAALRSAVDSSDPKLRRSAYYNVGNALLLAERYDEAIESFKVVLREDPSHQWARHNLEVAQRLRRAEFDLDSVAPPSGAGATSGAAAGDDSGAEGGMEGSAGSESGARQTPATSGDGHAGHGAGQADVAPSPSIPPPVNSGEEQAMRAQPRPMGAPQQADDRRVLQKLDALERRSGELRRGRVLRKTQRMVRSSGKAGSSQ